MKSALENVHREPDELRYMTRAIPLISRYYSQEEKLKQKVDQMHVEVNELTRLLGDFVNEFYPKPSVETSKKVSRLGERIYSGCSISLG